ncbi:hypothetical protein ACOSQ3_003209 [Xanthoceras sorbifolium]
MKSGSHLFSQIQLVRSCSFHHINWSSFSLYLVVKETRIELFLKLNFFWQIHLHFVPSQAFKECGCLATNSSFNWKSTS